MILVSIAPRQRNLTHGFQPKGRVAQSPGIQQSGFFIPATAIDATDNPPEWARCDGYTGKPTHRGKPSGVYASDRATDPDR